MHVFGQRERAAFIMSIYNLEEPSFIRAMACTYKSALKIVCQQQFTYESSHINHDLLMIYSQHLCFELLYMCT